jgi:hypothetical protein
MLSTALFSALLLAAASGDCQSHPERGEGWVVLQSPGPALEIWRFGQKLGQTPLKLTLPAGCAQIEARLPSGASQILRLEIEPQVEKTLAVKIDGPATATPVVVLSLRQQAQALYDRAVAGSPEAKEELLQVLERGLAASGTGSKAGCVRRPDGETGFLTLQTTPPSQVYLDGKLLGATPLSRVKLPAGCVEVEAVADDGTKKTMRLEVEANRVRIYSAKLP